MRHLNSIPGFQYVMAISETGQRTRAMVSDDYFWLSDCKRHKDGIWEGVVVNHLRNTHLHTLRHDDRVIFTPPEIEPHVLIQSEFGLFDTLREYPAAMDAHVAECPDCQKRVIKSGMVRLLPRLRAKMTVPQPEDWDQRYHSRHDLLQKMQPGQCLPCGCQVTSVPWSRHQVVDTFYKALAEVLQVSEDNAKKISEETRLLELPLAIKSLRRLRDKFWFPDGSSGSEEIRDVEEGDKVRQLPETIGQFIQQILSPHSGISYIECSEHWCP